MDPSTYPVSPTHERYPSSPSSPSYPTSPTHRKFPSYPTFPRHRKAPSYPASPTLETILFPQSYNDISSPTSPTSPTSSAYPSSPTSPIFETIPSPRPHKIVNPATSPTYEPISTLFPRIFTIEPSKISSPDLAIVDITAQPLYHITHNTTPLLPSTPTILLHNSASRASPPLASATLPSPTSTTTADISITLHHHESSPNPSTSHQDLIDLSEPSTLNSPPPASTTLLRPTGLLHSTWIFSFPLPSGQREEFAWKRSSNSIVASLDGQPHGLKLVGVRTRDVVAVYAGAKRSVGATEGKGKFRFLLKDVLGESFELMAVASVLAVAEMGRRREKGKGKRASWSSPSSPISFTFAASGEETGVVNCSGGFEDFDIYM